jgi:hypothetical protein
MRYALFLLAALSYAQTSFPTRVDITSNAARTTGGELRVNNSTNTLYGSYKSDYAGVETANYLTELYANGGGVKLWYQGLIGARVTLLPGGLAGVGQITLCDQTIANCTGWKASTASTGSVVYSRPPADGSAGDVLTTDGAGTLSWTAGGGGSSPPFVDTTNIIKGSADATKLLRFEVDGLTTATTRTWTAQDANITVAGIDLAQTWTATQTMRDVRPSVDDTYRLGDDVTPLRWYELNANRLNGICTTAFTCSQTNNYLNTRKLNLYDMNGSIGGGSWDLRTNAASPVTSYLEVRDQAGTAFLTLTRQAASVTVNNATLDGNLIPSSANDNVYDLGTSTVRWHTIEAGNTIIARLTSGGTRRWQMSGGTLAGIDGGGTTQFSASSLTGQILSGVLAGSGVRCLESDNSGNINLSATGCVPTSRTISTTSPLGGGGDLSANRTLTCTTCVTSVTGTSPISSSGGTTPAISCSTCVTTAGGQSISGTTTVSTLSVSTALSGTFNLSGNMTVTGNMYLRTYSGGSANCSGVADGWVGVRTDTGGASGMPQIEVCVGSAMKYTGLN